MNYKLNEKTSIIILTMNKLHCIMKTSHQIMKIVSIITRGDIIKINEENFNEILKGYLIRAIAHTKLTEEQEHDLLISLKWSLDEMTFEDALKEYQKKY